MPLFAVLPVRDKWNLGRAVITYTARGYVVVHPVDTSLLMYGSFGETSRSKHEVFLFGDGGVDIGYQEHARWTLYRVKGLHDSQVVGRKHGGPTCENNQRS